MSLDLIALIPASAESYEQALSVYHSEDELGDPSTPELRAFAEAIDSRFGDDDWPFTGDPLVFDDHVSLEVAHERWEEVVPVIVQMAHDHRLVILDPQSERLLRPDGGSPPF